eukprot:CAMPEP_0198426448 /NCGR_PEP_ID=MMETSP1452-20131203/5260_1 /TAXON_ID=1181717 /ORGANISM="Synchroma pusillum, Strain CCMP3072" /LENGTH=122 /DNA_ID=CAMNT_0044146821 /DNA_START=52 /DNA_END=416 /DNA_ORIENTATION=-
MASLPRVRALRTLRTSPVPSSSSASTSRIWNASMRPESCASAFFARSSAVRRAAPCPTAAVSEFSSSRKPSPRLWAAAAAVGGAASVAIARRRGAPRAGPPQRLGPVRSAVLVPRWPSPGDA